MKYIACLGLCLVMVATFMVGGDAAVRTIAYDNVHIGVPDPAEARAWYIKYLGATEGPGGRLYIGKTLIALVRAESAGPSVGSVIDHIGVSYADLNAKMRDFEMGGAKVLTAPRDVPGLFKLGFIEDPWGVKIEVVEDDEWPGFHHIHLRVPDPVATLAWYEEMLGGTRDKLKGRIDGLRYDGVWLLAADSHGEKLAPSGDRAIRNVAWTIADIDDAAATFKSKGVKTLIEPRPIRDLFYAFFEDPNGVSVELLQRPQ